MSSTQLILASGSPRRSQLLREWGYGFQVLVPDVVELDDPAIPIRELTARNARLKADAVAHALHHSVKQSACDPPGGPGIIPATQITSSLRSTVLVAADTLVLLGDLVLGKPRDRAEAAEMLAALVGRSHHVFTAVAILAGEQCFEFSVTTEVSFLPLTPEEQAAYHRLIDPLDKAGAYAAQDHGEMIIAGMTGSFTNVMGLPMERLSEVLASEFGITRQHPCAVPRSKAVPPVGGHEIPPED
jgi:septum formation protein